MKELRLCRRPCVARRRPRRRVGPGCEARRARRGIIGLALRESRILLTEDKDFGQLVFASAIESPGVVFIRFPASARQAMTRTVVTLVEASAEKLSRRFVVVQPGRIRMSERTPEK